MYETRSPEKATSGLFWQLRITLRTQTLYLSALSPQLVNFSISGLLSHDCNFAAMTPYIIFHTYDWKKEEMHPNCSLASVPFIKKAITSPTLPPQRPSRFLVIYHISQNWIIQLALTAMKEKGISVFQTSILAIEKGTGLAFEIQPIVYDTCLLPVLVMLVNYNWLRALV